MTNSDNETKADIIVKVLDEIKEIRKKLFSLSFVHKNDCFDLNQEERKIYCPIGFTGSDNQRYLVISEFREEHSLCFGFNDVISYPMPIISRYCIYISNIIIKKLLNDCYEVIGEYKEEEQEAGTYIEVPEEELNKTIYKYLINFKYNGVLTTVNNKCKTINNSWQNIKIV